MKSAFHIGDVITHRWTIDVAPSHQLDTATLPVRGRLNGVLSIVSVELFPLSSGHELVVQYLISGFRPRTREYQRPGFALQAADSVRFQPIRVPPWPFAIDSVLVGGEDGTVRINDLYPPLVPPRIPVEKRRWRLAALTATCLAAVCALGVLMGWWERIRGVRGPFARAYKQLRKASSPGSPGQPDDNEEAARVLHAAFNETAGYAVFAERLDEFFERCPAFTEQREAIESFYRESRALFFGVEREARSGNDLVELCARCCALERGHANTPRKQAR